MLRALPSQVDAAIALKGRAGHGPQALGAKRPRRFQHPVARIVGHANQGGQSHFRAAASRRCPKIGTVPAQAPQPPRPIAGTAPQREKRRQHQRRQLIAGQSQPDRRLGTDEFRAEAIDKISHQVEADKLPAKHPPPLKLPEHDGRREVEGRFVELRGVAGHAVAEIDAPGQRGGRSMAATGMEATQPADGDSHGQRHGEGVARLGADPQGPLGGLSPEVAAHQAGEEGLAAAQPGLAAEEALPIGQHKGEFGADHAAAKGPQGDSGRMPGQQFRRLRLTAKQCPAGRDGGEHDGRVGPVHRRALSPCVCDARFSRIAR